jgi:hypothetical protein
MINTLKYENLIDSFFLSSTNNFFYWFVDFPSSCDFRRFSLHIWAGVKVAAGGVACRFASSLTKSCAGAECQKPTSIYIKKRQINIVLYVLWRLCFLMQEYMPMHSIKISMMRRMRSSRVVRASDSQCRSRNCPGFDPSILRHSGIWGATDEAVLNIVRIKQKIT